MMEKNNIFLAGGDVFVYLAIPMHKKYSTTFAWGHPLITYVSWGQFFTLPPPPPLPPFYCKHMYAFRVTLSAVGLFQTIILNTIAYMYSTI